MADESSDTPDFIKMGLPMASSTVGEQVAYSIWGAVITATKAFEHAEIKVDTRVQRIFVRVRCRWWARFKKFEKLREAWLARADKRARQYVPPAWRLLVYYERPEDAGNIEISGRA